MSQHCVVVGAGHAAAQMVSSLRAEGWTGDITVIGDEQSAPYQRPPLSKAYLHGDISADKMLIRPVAFYEKHNVQLRLGVRVTEINRQAATVALSDDNILAYDYLCLATGARARRLDSVVGANLPGIHYLRTISDIDMILADLDGSNKAVIVGGGYIGLETAASLRKKNIEVTVLEAADRILQRVTVPVMSEFFARIHREEGVRVIEGVGLSEFVGHEGRVSGVKTTQDEILAADVVIVGIGVIVNDELAQSAGLTIDNGIVVDDYCVTSDEKILAIGDCTNHYNAHYDRRLRLESVPNANEQAKIAAKTLCDHRTPYNSLPWFWSDQYDVKLQIAGLSQGHDDIVVKGDMSTRSFGVFYLKDGKVISADVVNNPKYFMQAKKLIAAGDPLPEDM